MKKVVMILGASYYMIPAIKTARQMNLKTVVLDKNPCAPGFSYADYPEYIDITDVDKCIKIAKKYNVDAVIPLNDYGVLTASIISNELGLIGISPNIAAISLDKSKLRKIFEKINIPTPRFGIYSSLHTLLDDIYSGKLSFPLIIKPAKSFGGCRGVVKVQTLNDLKIMFNYSKKYSKNGIVLAEECILGNEYTVDIIIYEGDILIYGIGENKKINSIFPVNKGLIYPAKLSDDILNSLINIIRKIVKFFRTNLCTLHMEVILDNEDKIVYPIDLGFRCGAGGTIAGILIPYAYGLNMMEDIINIYLGNKINSSLNPNYFGSVLWFITKGKGRVKSIEGLDNIRKLNNIIDCKLFIKPGDIIGDIQSGLDRRGHIITKGLNPIEALKLAQKAEQLINIKCEPINLEGV